MAYSITGGKSEELEECPYYQKKCRVFIETKKLCPDLEDLQKKYDFECDKIDLDDQAHQFWETFEDTAKNLLSRI